MYKIRVKIEIIKEYGKIDNTLFENLSNHKNFLDARSAAEHLEREYEKDNYLRRAADLQRGRFSIFMVKKENTIKVFKTIYVYKNE